MWAVVVIFLVVVGVVWAARLWRDADAPTPHDPAGEAPCTIATFLTPHDEDLLDADAPNNVVALSRTLAARLERQRWELEPWAQSRPGEVVWDAWYEGAPVVLHLTQVRREAQPRWMLRVQASAHTPSTIWESVVGGALVRALHRELAHIGAKDVRWHPAASWDRGHAHVWRRDPL